MTVEEDIQEEVEKLKRYRQNGITTFKGLHTNSPPLPISATYYRGLLLSSGAELYEKLLSQRRQQKALEKDNSKQAYRSEESLLYQVLHQG